MRTSPTISAIAAAYLAGAVLFIPNILPILFSAVNALFQPSPVQLGFLYSAYSAACFVVTVTAPFWLRHLPNRTVAALGALLVSLLFWSMPALQDYGQLLAAFALIGIAAAFISAPGNAAVGVTDMPARWFGISATFTLGLAAVYALVVPIAIVPRFGAAAGLQAAALLFLPCALGALILKTRRASAGPVEPSRPDIRFSEGTPRERLGLAAAFAALLFYVLPAVSYWIFVERIGESYGASPGFVSVAVSTGIVCAVFGSLGFSLIAKRLSLAAFLGVGLVIISYLAILIGTPAAFFISLALFNIAWGITTPAFLSVIRRADFTDRFFVAGSGAILIGNTIAGPPAGLLAERLGYTTLIWLCILASLVIVPALLIALRAGAARPEPADLPAVAAH